MPPGGEDAARKFYSEALGMIEVAKSSALAARGGAWFTSGTVNLHLGVEPGFRPARQAHPGLRCPNFSPLVARLRALGFGPVEPVEDGAIPGVRRCHVYDPFGNRLELIAELV